MDVKTALERFEGDLLNLAPGTLRGYHHVARTIGTLLGPSNLVENLDAQQFIRVIHQLGKREYSRSTAITYATVLRRFLEFLSSEELLVLRMSDMLKINKALKDFRPRRQEKELVIPTAAEIAAIIDAAYSSQRPSPLRERNIAFIEVLACSGMRIGEVAGLRAGQINLEKHQALITGKGQHQRYVFFSSTAIAALRTYWSVRKDSAKASPALASHSYAAGKKTLKPVGTGGLRNVFDELAAAAGVAGFTPHKFRHAFASDLQRSSHDVELVRRALGHASINTTQVYLHSSPEDVQAAVDKIQKRPPQERS